MKSKDKKSCFYTLKVQKILVNQNYFPTGNTYRPSDVQSG